MPWRGFRSTRVYVVIGGATLQRFPQPRHRNHRRRLSGATARMRSALAASHCGHGGIRRRSWRLGSVRAVMKSGSLRMDANSRGGMSSPSVSRSPRIGPGGDEADCRPSTERTSRLISGTESSSSRARRGRVCTSSARFHTDAVPVRSSVSYQAFPDTRREDVPARVDREMRSRSHSLLRRPRQPIRAIRVRRSASRQHHDRPGDLDRSTTGMRAGRYRCLSHLTRSPPRLGIPLTLSSSARCRYVVLLTSASCISDDFSIITSP